MLCIATPSCAATEVDRIRAVFGLAEGAPLPHVDVRSLRLYQAFLSERLTLPFEALYAENTPPIRHLVRYLRVTGISDIAGHVSEGLLCRVQGLPHIKELALAEIGVREEDPNYELIDDYAYWLYNWR